MGQISRAYELHKSNWIFRNGRAVLCTLACASSKGDAAAAAPSVSSLYVYELENAGRSVPNRAARNEGVALRLEGAYAPTPSGVRFDGDLKGSSSVGHARPQSGSTLDVPPGDAVGVGIRFEYLARAAGCHADSANLTQIGRFAAGVAQVKLQLSNCKHSRERSVVQCRMAGASSSSAPELVSSKEALRSGETYVAQCIKGPDRASGEAAVRLTVQRVAKGAASQAGAPQVESAMIPATGIIRSQAHLSVANKYALPEDPSKNTDQFVGKIAAVAYCQASSSKQVIACLEEEL